MFAIKEYIIEGMILREEDMKKLVKIVCITVLIIFLVLFAVYFVIMYNFKMSIKSELPVCVRTEMITDYETKLENAQLVENNVYSIQIPDYLSLQENRTNDVRDAYWISGWKEVNYWLEKKPDFIDGSLLKTGDNYSDDWMLKLCGGKPERMFQTLPYGMPDSYYNTVKAALLLDWKDYDMLNLYKSMAFKNYALLRELYNETSKLYLYERDDVRAIVERWKSGTFVIEVYSTDDLNSCYDIMIDDPGIGIEGVTAIMNTLEFK